MRRVSMLVVSGVVALLSAGLGWWAWPDAETRADSAIVDGLVHARPLDDGERKAVLAAVDEARIHDLRGAAGAARAWVMDDPARAEAWLAWVELSEPGAPEALSASEAAAVGRWLRRHDGDAAAVAQAWVALRADQPEQVGILLPAPQTLPVALRLSGLAVVVRAKEALAADPAEELRAALALAPTHRRACVGLTRVHLLDGDLGAVEALTAQCLREGPPAPELVRAKAAAADRLGRPAAAREAYASAGFFLHAAAVAVQDDLPAAEAEWRAAVGDPVPPAAMHRVLGGVLLGDMDAVRSGVAALEASGVPDPSIRLAAATGALALGDAARALAALDGLEGAAAEVLRARALVDASPVDARAALDRAWTLGPDLAVAAAHLALLPAETEVVRSRLAEADPIELGLLAHAVDRDRPWAAMLPPSESGQARRPPVYGLPGALVPSGVSTVLSRVESGRCAVNPADPLRVQALCGAGIARSEDEIASPDTRLGDLALAAVAAAATGDRAQAQAAAAALTRRAPNWSGPARLRADLSTRPLGADR